MVDLPQKKVGIIACSGEELPEGTITRLAALRVLEQLRPAETVTICLPLFLAGGEGDRAFARFYPTIAVDGCELRCAARGTEKYSGKPAASLVVSELVNSAGLAKPQGCRRLDQAGQQAVEILAAQIAAQVDELIAQHWNRRTGEFTAQFSSNLSLPILESTPASPAAAEPVIVTCSCGSGIPVQTVTINGQPTILIALPVLFQQFKEAGKAPSQENLTELFELVQVYNQVPAGEEPAYREVISREYSAYWQREVDR